MSKQQYYNRTRWRLRFTKINILIAIIIILLVISPFIYSDYRKNSLKKEVEIYLKQQGYEEKDIDKLEPFRSFKGYGDRNYMVDLKLKGDKGGYNLYKDSETSKIRVDIHTLNGESYFPNDLPKK